MLKEKENNLKKNGDIKAKMGAEDHIQEFTIHLVEVSEAESFTQVKLQSKT